MREFVIGKNDVGQRLDRFLTKVAPNLPKSLLYKYLRIKRIKVNGKRGEIATRLLEGDRVSAYISDEFFTPVQKHYDFLGAARCLTVVYEDENLLLCDKPQGLLSHPDEHEYGDTLITRIQRYLYEKGEYDPEQEHSFRPALANRIDRNTGGIVIAAKNAEALRILCEKIKTREIDKRYLAVVHGKMEKPEAEIEGYLQKNEKKNKVFIQSEKTAENRTIRTRYRVIREKNGLSLLEVFLLTGRTHQIRAHMASLGHPLLGDGKYGKRQQDKKLGFDKQALYSYRLTFDFRSDAGILNGLAGKEFRVSSVWFAEKWFGIDCGRLP